jgi:hypothetical protein
VQAGPAARGDESALGDRVDAPKKRERERFADVVLEFVSCPFFIFENEKNELKGRDLFALSDHSNALLLEELRPCECVQRT